MKNFMVAVLTGISLLLAGCAKPNSTAPTGSSNPVVGKTPVATISPAAAASPAAKEVWESRVLIPDVLSIDAPAEFTVTKNDPETGDKIIQWLTPDERFGVLLRIYETPSDIPKKALTNIAQSMAKSLGGEVTHQDETEFGEEYALRFGLSAKDDGKPIELEVLGIAMENKGTLQIYTHKGEHDRFFDSLTWASSDEEWDDDEDDEEAEEGAEEVEEGAEEAVESAEEDEEYAEEDEEYAEEDEDSTEEE